MSYITGDFPVMAGGKTVGRLNIEQVGLMLVFNCTCEYKSRDVLRLAAVCGGKYVPLGVMIPDTEAQSGVHKGSLHLKKSLTKNTLTSIGYDEAVSFHLIKPGAVYAIDAETEPEPAFHNGDADEDASTPDAQNNQPENVLSADDTEPIVYVDFPDPAEYEYDPADYGLELDSVGSANLPVPALEDHMPKSENAANDNQTTHKTPEPEPFRQVHKPASQVPAQEPVAVSAEKFDSADGWMSISNPCKLFDDSIIQESCTEISNALFMEQNGYVLLAVPVIPTEPFPMMPVFCFGNSGAIAGQECIIFKIKNGHLVL